MTRTEAATEFAGRAFIAFLFLAGFVQKLIDPASGAELLALLSLPGWLIWPAAVFNLAAGVALLAGVAVRPVALALAAYCVATSAFHLALQDPWQTTIAVKNWTIAGGCLILAVHGPGPWRLGR
ncbi:DoxX family membrane protein [Rhodobacterales bacterium HKCCE3408]|nr:DoxX family membrane protein [Rhodobacterales bacterium HKCCE3408]